MGGEGKGKIDIAKSCRQYVSMRQGSAPLHLTYVSIRQHTSASDIRQHTSAYVSIRQHIADAAVKLLLPVLTLLPLSPSLTPALSLSLARSLAIFLFRSLSVCENCAVDRSHLVQDDDSAQFLVVCSQFIMSSWGIQSTVGHRTDHASFHCVLFRRGVLPPHANSI
jgi:hypothetical protein